MNTKLFESALTSKINPNHAGVRRSSHKGGTWKPSKTAVRLSSEQDVRSIHLGTGPVGRPERTGTVGRVAMVEACQHVKTQDFVH